VGWQIGCYSGTDENRQPSREIGPGYVPRDARSSVRNLLQPRGGSKGPIPEGCRQTSSRRGPLLRIWWSWGGQCGIKSRRSLGFGPWDGRGS